MKPTAERRPRRAFPIAVLLGALLSSCTAAPAPSDPAPVLAVPVVQLELPITVASDARYDVEDAVVTGHKAPVATAEPADDTTYVPEPTSAADVPTVQDTAGPTSAPALESLPGEPQDVVPDSVSDTAPPAAGTPWALPAPAAPPAKGPGATVSIYVAPPPVGNDANDASANSPVATLAGAQARARAAQTKLGTPANIDVIIAGGQYATDGVTWKLAAPGQRIQFAAAPGQQPVFTGTGNGSKYWLEILTTATAGSTTFDVRGITVRGYINGLRISTGYLSDPAAVPIAIGNGPRLNGPVVTAMTFEQIGSAFAAGNGYSSLHLQNTHGAQVTANTFTRIENTPATSWLVHAVYAVSATGTTITGNDFTTVSGDPIRTRNATSATIAANRFTATGRVAATSDWFCGIDCALAERKAPECAAIALTVHSNIAAGTYDGRPLPQSAVITPRSQAARGC